MKNDKFLTNYHLDDYFRYLHSVATPPEAVPTELHNFFELYYFIAGDMVFYIEGKAYKLDSGDIMVINSDELHRASPLSAKPYERVVIHFNRRCLDGFSGEDYHILDFLTKRKVGQANLIESKKIDTAPLFAHLWKIEEAAKEKARHSAALIKTCFIQLLIEMNRIYAHKTDQIITPKHYDERIAAILKYINTNLSRKISLDELERNLYINKYYLCHIFKKNTGFTVFEYISNKRIMRAKQLLSRGVPVMETCYTVGFGDYSNFYKVFKRVTGIPPKQFAKEN